MKLFQTANKKEGAKITDTALSAKLEFWGCEKQ